MSEPVALHVTQMDGFEQPPLDPPPLTVWNMTARADIEAPSSDDVSTGKGE
jgi:hypothetical protein